MTILETIPKYYIPVYSTPIRISTKKGNFIGIYKPIRLVLWKMTVNICIKYQKNSTWMEQHFKWTACPPNCRGDPRSPGQFAELAKCSPDRLAAMSFVPMAQMTGRPRVAPTGYGDFSAPLGRRAGQCPAPTDTIAQFRKIVGGGPM